MDTQTFRCRLLEHPKDDSPELFQCDLDALINNESFSPTHIWRDGDVLSAWLEWKFTGDGSGIAIAADASGRMADWTDPPPNSDLIHIGEPLDLQVRLSDQYRERGFVMLPLDGKACKLHGWTKFTATPKADWYGKNVGLLLGDASGGLMDIDLDGPGATRLGEVLFRDLPASGRATSRASHRWFISTGACKTTKWKLGKAEAEAVGLTTDDKCMLVELRGNKNQTMVAPSLHPDTGETVEWHGGFPETFPERDPDEIHARAQLLAVLCVVALRWPAEGSRDDTSLALAGALLRYDWMTVRLCNELVGRVAELGGDNEPRNNKAESTAEKLAADEPVTGWNTVFENCGITAELLRKLRGWTGTAGEAPEGVIAIQPGLLGYIIGEIEQRLINSDENIFQRGTHLCRTTRLPEREELGDGVVAPAGSLLVLHATNGWMQKAVDRNMQFVRFDPRAKKWRPADPPGKHLNVLMDSAGEWSFPVLRGVSNTPILLPDGELVTDPGYHAPSGLFLDTHGTTFPDLGNDVAAAKDMLLAPFAEYQWAPDSPGPSIVLSAILSVLGRNLLRTVPLHAIDAIYPGSGKSFLCQAVGVIALGRGPVSVVLTNNEAENQKRIETAMIASPQLLLLDNCTEEIGGNFLCQLVTEEELTIRLLGAHRETTLINNVLVMANGNGLTFFGDITRRVLHATIDPNRPDPENAQFAFNPVQLAQTNRPQLVMAALTILREYLRAGCPNKPEPIGSFEDYSLVRGALVWAGLADPCTNMERIKEQDPAIGFLREALELWPQCFTEPVALSEIAEAAFTGAASPERLRSLLRMACGLETWDTRRVGQKLSSFVGRWVDLGDRLVRLEGKPVRNAKKYFVHTDMRQKDMVG